MIIAELCQNHNGDKEVLRDLIFAAAANGATYAKIQTFFAKDLAEEWKGEYDRLKSLELNWDMHHRFVEWCGEARIKPMTSVYSPEYIELLKSSGFKHVKIGSAQATDSQLIRRYLAAGFSVSVSTGGHRLNEIESIPLINCYMHCVSKYPSHPEEANMLRMLKIKRVFEPCGYGLSDHTDPLDPFWALPSKVAMFLGATMIEKHFTILPRGETRDGSVSIVPYQLKELYEFSKKSREDMLARYPAWGLWLSDQDEYEREIITKYKGRWAPLAH